MSIPGADEAELVYQTHPELRNEIICKDCNRLTNIVEDHKSGDYICTECGRVVGDRVIDLNSEWRTFANDKGEDQGDPSRVGSAVNPLLNGADLTTSVGMGPGPDSKILGRAHARSTANKIDKQLQKSYRLISDYAGKLYLPDSFTLKAKQIFKQMADYHTKQRGGAANPFGAIVGTKKTEAVALAALFLACRHEGNSRSYKEFASISNVRRADIGQAVKTISITLGIESSVAHISEYIPRVCDGLNLSPAITKLASAIATKANEDIIEVSGYGY